MRSETRAAEGDLPCGPSFGVYKSSDGGDTWVEKNAGLEGSDRNINDIAVHPLNPALVYIGTLHDGVYKTTDGGESWTPMSNGLMSANVQCLALDPTNPEAVYAGLGEGSGICKSINGGELWQEINAGIPLQCPSSLLPVGKVNQGISLQAPSKLMFTGRDYYSIPWTTVRSIIIDPTNPPTIYAADYSSGVYLSTDGGMNWEMINDGLSTKAVSALAISGSGKVLYAATSGEGVFRLTLEETDLTELYKLTPWDVNQDQVVDILDLAFLSQYLYESPPTDLRADVNDDGIVDISDFVVVGQHFGEDYHAGPPAAPGKDVWNISPEYLSMLQLIYDLMTQSPRSDEKFLATKRLILRLIAIAQGQVTESKLWQNYPNPFNPDTWMPYQLAQPGKVTISIYNISGQLIRRLDLGYKTSGFYLSRGRAAYWDGQNEHGEQVSSGVYFYTINATSKTGDFTAGRKMILLK
jgi:hypothetical protein